MWTGERSYLPRPLPGWFPVQPYSHRGVNVIEIRERTWSSNFIEGKNPAINLLGWRVCRPHVVGEEHAFGTSGCHFLADANFFLVPPRHVRRAENCGNIIGEMDQEMSVADTSKADDASAEAYILKQVGPGPMSGRRCTGRGAPMGTEPPVVARARLCTCAQVASALRTEQRMQMEYGKDPGLAGPEGAPRRSTEGGAEYRGAQPFGQAHAVLRVGLVPA